MAVGGAAALLGALLLAGTRASARGEAPRRSDWAQAATTSCRRIQEHISLHGWNYWKPLAVYPPYGPVDSRDAGRIPTCRRSAHLQRRDLVDEVTVVRLQGHCRTLAHSDNLAPD
jgi:hypothetical protein